MLARIFLITLFSLSIAVFTGCGENTNDNSDETTESKEGMDPDAGLMQDAGKIEIDQNMEGAEGMKDEAIPDDADSTKNE